MRRVTADMPCQCACIWIGPSLINVTNEEDIEDSQLNFYTLRIKNVEALMPNYRTIQAMNIQR